MVMVFGGAISVMVPIFAVLPPSLIRSSSSENNSSKVNPWHRADPATPLGRIKPPRHSNWNDEAAWVLGLRRYNRL